MRICIQGYEGSFHQLAAQRFYGEDVTVIPCASFRELTQRTSENNTADGGIMAIENSIAGSILSNYNLLHKSDLQIVGEVYLQIEQQLLVNPGVTLEDIREVHSHTMALQQCFEFLDKHRWKLVETEDTALSAKHVHQHKSRHIAAIAGRLAAELFHLQILAADIHTLKTNYTRFLVLQNRDHAMSVEGVNKASLSFVTQHARGSLAKVLTAIADCGINLSKLQSFPIPGSDFRYNFHADMEFEERGQFEEVISHVTPLTDEVRIYGLYKRGR